MASLHGASTGNADTGSPAEAEQCAAAHVTHRVGWRTRSADVRYSTSDSCSALVGMITWTGPTPDLKTPDPQANPAVSA